MNLFDDPAYMAESKAWLRHYVATGEMIAPLSAAPADERPKRAYRFWLPEDHAELARRLTAGETITAAARAMGVPVGSASSAINVAGGRAAYINQNYRICEPVEQAAE